MFFVTKKQFRLFINNRKGLYSHFCVQQFVNKNKYLAITSAGYDEYYILPGGNNLQVENGGLSDDLTGASKAKLKSAFGKSMKGKISSRQLLDKFVKLVA